MAEVESIFPTADRHELEVRIGSELERLPGVISAAAWLADSGRLRDARLHVMPGASATIIANAAAGVLRAHGIIFEASAVRVLTVALPDGSMPLAASGATGGHLLVLHDLTISRSGSHVAVHVQLMRAGTVSAGEAQELDTGAGRTRATALATLRAAEQSAEGVALGLEGANVIPIFGRSYAVVAVEAALGRRVASLNGMVAVEPTRAPEEAVCLAALRAVDRWMAIS